MSIKKDFKTDCSKFIIRRDARPCVSTTAVRLYGRASEILNY
ncbi:MAG: hypothetical protein VSS75_006220 [Candidatus Parabeggiatoa sp.]|nr:hypothetical protein [Candidatus Parabeggiatoa sp.]